MQNRFYKQVHKGIRKIWCQFCSNVLNSLYVNKTDSFTDDVLLWSSAVTTVVPGALYQVCGFVFLKRPPPCQNIVQSSLVILQIHSLSADVIKIGIDRGMIKIPTLCLTLTINTLLQIN